MALLNRLPLPQRSVLLLHFIEDFSLIKGNTESGPVPSVMAAYGEFFKDRAAAAASLEKLRALYRRRLEYVIPRLRGAGLRPACSLEERRHHRHR